MHMIKIETLGTLHNILQQTCYTHKHYTTPGRGVQTDVVLVPGIMKGLALGPCQVPKEEAYRSCLYMYIKNESIQKLMRF